MRVTRLKMNTFKFPRRLSDFVPVLTSVNYILLLILKPLHHTSTPHKHDITPQQYKVHIRHRPLICAARAV